MQINIEETTVVCPFKPPFHDDHILFLSHIDTDRNLLVTLRYLRFYSNNPQQQDEEDPYHVISAALSAALVRYYPFARTLIRRSSDGRLELRCQVSDGVPLVASFPLSADIDENIAEQLAPDPDPSDGSIRPITLQVTRFGCGGFVLGAAVHHAICDGIGATLFFNAMADLARGSDQLSIDPVWNRIDLLGPRDSPRIEFPIQEALNLDSEFYPYKESGKRVVREYINVREEWLDELKELLN